MKTSLRIILVILPVLVLPFEMRGQIDTINISRNELQIQFLKEGLHQYIVYLENPKRQRLGGISIWNRNVSLKKLKGIETIEIEQYWYMSDTLYNRYVYSISNRRNFEPIYHYTHDVKATEAFDFETQKIKGSDTVINNAKREFEVGLTTPTLNWELDLEIFSTYRLKG